MYVLGGYTGADLALHMTASVLKFDSVQAIWSVVAPMPQPRCDFAACVVGSDIYVIGGVDEVDVRQGSVFRYDSENNEWSTLASIPGVGSGHSAIELSGLVYTAGAGCSTVGFLRYDPASEVWSTLASLMHGCYHGAFFVLAGCLYVAGGDGTESHVQRYDVTADAWTEEVDMLEERCHFRAVTIGAVGAAEEQDLFDSLIAQAARRNP
jgi:hypothetical protein